MTIGTEHEYSINDEHFNALPVSDLIIKTICGRFASEILFGDVKLGKELQKTVIEIIPRNPSDDLVSLERHLFNGIRKFYHIFRDRYYLLGLGMHPTLVPCRSAVWDHDEGEFYETYDRIFNIQQHGWLNIQALQINLSYSGENELLTLYNRIRLLLPYLIAVTASSPMVEGVLTGPVDNRLVFYRKNQKEIPLICNRIIPEKIQSVNDYLLTQKEIFSALRARDADILCEEWVNSSGLIVRFSRNCLEVKALDEQECIHSDMAVCAFLQSLLRCPELPVPRDQQSLLEATDKAIRGGTAEMRPELLNLFKTAWKHASAEERQYLPVIEDRIKNGSLGELIRDRYEREGDIVPVLRDMAECLKTNSSYGGRNEKA